MKPRPTVRQQRFIQLQVSGIPAFVNCAPPRIQRSNVSRKVIASKENLIMFVEQLVLVMRYVWSLTMPGHEVLSELRNINSLSFITVGRAILTTFCDKIARRE